ncbi:MAG: carbamoyltransferase C-terminal domain-containing protein [Acidobacteriota bacterium]
MGSGYYLGIFEGHADPAVAIVKDGRVIAFAEEERFIRQKHAWGIYPANALRFCLSEAGIRPEEVEAIAINWDLEGYSNGRIRAFYDDLNSRFEVDAATRAWQNRLLAKFNRDNTINHHGYQWRRLFGDIEMPKIFAVPHHFTHAFQSVMHSGFDESVCITIDGSGDEDCTVIWEHRGNDIRPIYRRRIPDSLGWFYAAFTEYLGFRAYDGEYKLMGLAAYGKPDAGLIELVGEIIKPAGGEDPGYTIDPHFIHFGQHSYSDRYTDRLVELFGRPPRVSTEEYTEWHENLAFAVQFHLEQAAERLALWAIKQTGITKITIGGGVGLNVKMNSRLFQLPEVSDLWANPLCSDGGAAVGAALYAEYAHTAKSPEALKRLDFGPREDDIESVLRQSKVPFRHSQNIAGETARLLSEGKIVGWFQGRMEAGPRALGYRSILADPRDSASRDKVNAIIKFREYWRPFCPSIPAEKADYYFNKYTRAPFMVIAFPANERLQHDAPAVVHVDGTARVQFVEKDVNPRYHALLSEFERLTGVGVLLNTSFNVKGEPIVCTARDALRTFWSTGLDVLVIGDYIIEKPLQTNGGGK